MPISYFISDAKYLPLITLHFTLEACHAFLSKKVTLPTEFIVNTFDYELQSQLRILCDIHISALIREITKRTSHVFRSQNYQLHTDSEGILIMIRDRMPDLRAVSILFSFYKLLEIYRKV